jgi:outer membrane protein OmpA-like peptidoglycan-associated protein
VLDETYHNISATAGVVFSFGGGNDVADKTVVVPEPLSVKTPEKVVVVVAEEPEVVEKVEVLVAEPKVVILAFEDVHFDFDKSTLTPEAQAILRDTAKIMNENPNAHVRIAGYTSASGTGEYNQALSERRANAVKAYLVDQKLIAPGKLVTIGFGETSPAEHESAPKDLYSKAAKANMRVLFEIVVK